LEAALSVKFLKVIKDDLIFLGKNITTKELVAIKMVRKTLD
jgi:hypothetical protein